MKKISAMTLAAALALATSAFAAGHDDAKSTSPSSTAPASAHQVAGDFKAAMHKLGTATRHALERADASLHRMTHRDRDRDGKA